MLTAPPAGDWSEVGTIDMQYGGMGITDIARFKEKVQAQVCDAGGEVAVAFVNGQGVYIKAAVLKRVRPSPASIAPPPAAATGCQFDTQCKGDRICVDGKCVAPAPKANSTDAPPAGP